MIAIFYAPRMIGFVIGKMVIGIFGQLWACGDEPKLGIEFIPYR